MLNQSHLEHAAVAVAIQLVLGLITGDYWVGAAAGIYFFLGREIRDAELRYRFDRNLDWDDVPDYAGLHPSVWQWPEHSDGWLDWVVPTLACLAVACIIEFGF